MPAARRAAAAGSMASAGPRFMVTSPGRTRPRSRRPEIRRRMRQRCANGRTFRRGLSGFLGSHRHHGGKSGQNARSAHMRGRGLPERGGCGGRVDRHGPGFLPGWMRPHGTECLDPRPGRHRTRACRTCATRRRADGGVWASTSGGPSSPLTTRRGFRTRRPRRRSPSRQGLMRRASTSGARRQATRASAISCVPIGLRSIYRCGMSKADKLMRPLRFFRLGGAARSWRCRHDIPL
jgi:hypothetical protein